MCKPKAPKVTQVQQVVAATPPPAPDVSDPVEVVTANVEDKIEQITSGKRGQRTLRIGKSRAEDARRAAFVSGAKPTTRSTLRISKPTTTPTGGGTFTGGGGGGGGGVPEWKLNTEASL